MDGLLDMEKLLKLKSTDFVGGSSGLQAKRTCAIASYLALVVSQLAAETHGFVKMWGGRQIQSWARAWMSQRTLLLSLTGHHAKTYSLLSDPGIAVELHTYMQSNKWALDPEKLATFTKNQLIPAEAEKYTHKIIDNEMPSGLKQYMKLELFPQIHLKAKKGISLATACQWLHHEGFKYSTHKKGVYFDGHDHPDFVDYHQNVFLPKMQEYSCQLVRYSVEDPSYDQASQRGLKLYCWNMGVGMAKSMESVLHAATQIQQNLVATNRFWNVNQTFKVRNLLSKKQLKSLVTISFSYQNSTVNSILLSFLGQGKEIYS